MNAPLSIGEIEYKVLLADQLIRQRALELALARAEQEKAIFKAELDKLAAEKKAAEQSS